MEFSGTASPLTSGDIKNEASALDVDAAAISAVCQVESAHSGFLPDKRPKILFEAHAFHTLTRGVYDRAYPNISAPFWDRSLYGPSGAHQYDRLSVAIGLNRLAGLESASWGRFQIMGSNYKAAGFSDVEKFVQAMMDSEANHLLAFGNFCQSTGILGYLRDHDWEHFALRYNGPGNVADYAGKLADAYEANQSTGPTSDPTGSPTLLRVGSTGVLVVRLQQQLNKLRYQISVDGSFGPRTEQAVVKFQQKHSLIADGEVGSLTAAALDALVPQVP